MNKILSVLLLLIISFFVVGCSSKVETAGYYKDAKVLTEMDMKELSDRDKRTISILISDITLQKFRSVFYNCKFENNQLIGFYEQQRGKYPDEYMLSTIKDVHNFWVLNAPIFINKYLEDKKEAEKLFIGMKNTKLDKSKINVISGNLSPEIRDHILKSMKVVENPKISSMIFDDEFTTLIWNYLPKEYTSSTEKFRNYMIDKYVFSPATIYFLNESKMLTMNDFKNESININITFSSIDLTQSEQIFENEDLRIITSKANEGRTDIRWIHYINKTDKYINLKTTSLYLGENVYQNSSFSEISLSPFAKTPSINFLNRDYLFDRSIPPSVKVKVADLEQTNINFGYAVKYEINGKEKTFIKTKFLTYKDFK